MGITISLDVVRYLRRRRRGQGQPCQETREAGDKNQAGQHNCLRTTGIGRVTTNKSRFLLGRFTEDYRYRAASVRPLMMISKSIQEGDSCFLYSSTRSSTKELSDDSALL